MSAWVLATRPLPLFYFLYAGSLYEYSKYSAYPECQQEHAGQE